MTLKERIHSWMTGREEELLEALAPLVAVNSVAGEAAPRNALWSRSCRSVGTGSGACGTVGNEDPQ